MFQNCPRILRGVVRYWARLAFFAAGEVAGVFAAIAQHPVNSAVDPSRFQYQLTVKTQFVLKGAQVIPH